MSKFKKGQSGNPKGRPKGIVDRRSRYIELLESHMPAVVDKVAAAAQEGDLTACKLLLDKVLPNVRAQSRPMRLPERACSDIERARAIADGLMTGNLSPEQAATAMTVIVEGARLRELIEFEARLEALERKNPC